jgi:hypothetical protein
MKAWLTALGAGAVLAASAALATPAHADTAPELSCGITVTTSCSQTAQFTDLNSWGTPLGATGPGCPAYLANDYVLMVGTGDGVEHQSINGNGDFTASSTFTGSGSITLYSPAHVDVTPIDGGQDITATPTGPADGVFTGHFSQHFGAQETRQGTVFELTFSFVGTDASGQPFAVHVTEHQNWTPGSQPFLDPPRHSSLSVHC